MLCSVLQMFSSVQSLSCVRLCDPKDWSMPGFPVHHQLPDLLRLVSMELVIRPSHPLLLLLLLLSRFSCVRLCATPSAAHQAPPSPGILQARTLEWVAISFSNA